MIEYRSVIGRDRIASQYYRLIKDAAQRIINKEAKSIQKQIKMNRSKRGSRDFKKWLDEFYRQMPSYIKKQLGPTFQSFIEAIAYQALNEVGADPEVIEKKLLDFIVGYFEAYQTRHINRSYYQVQGILRDSDLPDFEDQLDDITGTVGQLDKLSKLDPELLQKYSRVFFLNEHYAPDRFKEIEERYLVNKDEPEYVHAEVEPFLDDLLDDARQDGVNLLILSAFRSYDEQKQLKSIYTVTYGTGANTFSADQGYSEHQLGTTVDFTNNVIGAGLDGFQNTKEYKWLWRFVGEDLARDLNRKGENFYDLDQRDIDDYLINIFD